MTEKITHLDIKSIRKYIPCVTGEDLANDFFFSYVKYNSNLSILNSPCRIDGYLAIFCIKGEMEVEINQNKYKIDKNVLLINVPGNIFQVSQFNALANRDMEFFVIGMSKEYVSTIRVDFNKLFNDSVSFLSNPSINLNKASLKLSRKYIAIAVDILNSDLANKKGALGSLMSSLLYILGEEWSKRLSEAKSTLSTHHSARSSAIFDKFLELVTLHHTTHRNMAFYADKLSLTPKYLSKVVKTVSGKSAPNWIDSFVISEAKNLLRYSNITIKELVYKLNFQNQSVFYKFFKAQTGMTPSEYRHTNI